MAKLQVPKRKPKRKRQGRGVEIAPHRAVAPNYVWTLDL